MQGLGFKGGGGHFMWILLVLALRLALCKNSLTDFCAYFGSAEQLELSQ